MTRHGAFPFLNKQQPRGAGHLLSLPASPAPFAAIQPLSKLVPMDTYHTFLINRPSVQQGDRKNPSVSSQLKGALQSACTNWGRVPDSHQERCYQSHGHCLHQQDQSWDSDVLNGGCARSLTVSCASTAGARCLVSVNGTEHHSP